MFRGYSELCDVVSAAVLCSADNTMLLLMETSTEYFFPNIKAPLNSSWSDAISKDMSDIFGVIPVTRILRLTKIWAPGRSPPYLIHCTYLLNINGELKEKSKNVTGRYKGKIKWVNESELGRFQMNKALRTPEVYECFYLARNQATPGFAQQETAKIRGNFMEICDDILVTEKSSVLESIVLTSEFTKTNQEVLFKDFLVNTFPASIMGVTQFAKVMAGFGWGKDDAIALFRAADLKNRRGVPFRDLLYLLATMDPKVNLQGAMNDMKDAYLFNFYDKDSDNVLNQMEFKQFISDTRKVRKLQLDIPNITKDVSEGYKLIGVAEGALIARDAFLKAVRETKFKGIPLMLRSSTEVGKYVASKAPAFAVHTPAGDTSTTNAARSTPLTMGTTKEFDLGNHTIKINKDSNQITVEQIYSVQDSASVNTMKKPPGSDAVRRTSLDVFSPKSVSNEVLKAIRYLTPLNKKLLSPPKNEKPSYNWGQLDSTTFIRNLISVANSVKEILRKEPRLLRLNSPMYIMGDLHGNIFDLLHFEATLWHLGANLCPCELLFLGDFVDRGAFSLEVISYLFSYKLQNPDKVHLLRGNHEIRDVQKMFTFYGECILKCGDKIGIEVWNTLNSAFDNMPVAAVIDNKIFCCHGGCPPPWLCPVVSAINDIPVPLSAPNQQSSLAWEIMWNDPVKPKQMNDKLNMELMANEGFAVNSRRGTAHVFSAEALDRFLKANKLTHLIRAHEVVEAGYYVVQQRGRMITIFSSSRYCGGDNEAACVLVDQGKLRILRLAREEK